MICAWNSALVSCGFCTRIARACPGLARTSACICASTSNSSPRDLLASAAEIWSLPPPGAGGAPPTRPVRLCPAAAATSIPSAGTCSVCSNRWPTVWLLGCEACTRRSEQRESERKPGRLGRHPRARRRRALAVAVKLPAVCCKRQRPRQQVRARSALARGQDGHQSSARANCTAVTAEPARRRTCAAARAGLGAVVGEVDAQRAAADLVAVQVALRALAGRQVVELAEAVALGLAGVAVRDQPAGMCRSTLPG